ncbi:MAG: efflux RND transporter periplasmic adaptor subunit [Steroidobacteraceae bacterium]
MMRLRKAFLRVPVLLALVLILPAGLVAMLASHGSRAAETKNTGPSVLVATTPVGRGSLPQRVMAFGTVQADSSARDSIMAPLPAVVGEIYVRAGEALARGAPLLRLLPSPQTAASYAQAVSALHVARDSLTHTRQLLAQRLATRQQLADAEKIESDARAALDALKTQGAAGATTLRAPFRSIVTSISTSVRAIAAEGAPLIELVRPDGLILSVGAVPGDAARITPGDQTRITPIGAGESFRSKVVMRGSVVDSATGLVPVQIALPPGALLPGQWAQAAITVGAVEGYIVPHEAVLVDDSGATYVVQAIRGLARIVHVRVLGAEGTRDAVDGPLDEGAPLVLSGNYQLRDGMKVRFANSAAARRP